MDIGSSRNGTLKRLVLERPFLSLPWLFREAGFFVLEASTPSWLGPALKLLNFALSFSDKLSSKPADFAFGPRSSSVVPTSGSCRVFPVRLKSPKLITPIEVISSNCFRNVKELSNTLMIFFQTSTVGLGTLILARSRRVNCATTRSISLFNTATTSATGSKTSRMVDKESPRNDSKTLPTLS